MSPSARYEKIEGGPGPVGSESRFKTVARPLTWVGTIVLIAISLYHIPYSTMASSVSQSATLEDQVQAANALKSFSIQLLQAVGKLSGPSENVFISPFSVAAVLSMVDVGAKGETSSQIKNSLGLSEISVDKIHSALGSLVQNIKGDGQFTLTAANKLYVAENYKLTDSFQTTLKESYGAPAQSVNFAVDAARSNINKWVEDFTHHKIKDLLPAGSVDALTKLVLVNALYFKGNWMRKFDSSKTKTEPFFMGNKDSKIDVNMMHIDAEFRSGYIESLDARVLELPYVGRKLSMFIVLPNQIDGLSVLESKMHESALDELDMEMSSAKMHVAIPKFKLEADVKLKDVLIQMGMSHLFKEELADLSGISGKKDLYVSNIFHKSFINVNEEGSEAAAATGAVMMTRMMIMPVQPPPPFVADHPFYFYIREKATKLVLFSGRLVQPPSK